MITPTSLGDLKRLVLETLKISPSIYDGLTLVYNTCIISLSGIDDKWIFNNSNRLVTFNTSELLQALKNKSILTIINDNSKEE